MPTDINRWLGQSLKTTVTTQLLQVSFPEEKRKRISHTTEYLENNNKRLHTQGLSASVPKATQAIPIPQFILHISIKHSLIYPKQPNLWSWSLKCVCIAMAQYKPKVSHTNKGTMVTGWAVGKGLSLGGAARLGRRSRFLDGQDRKED